MKTLTKTETAACQSVWNLETDGVWGPKTQAAFEQWAGIAPAKSTAAANQWPTEQELEKFYGSPGTGHVRINPPYPLYYDGKRVPSITVHHKIAEAVKRVLAKVLTVYGPERIRELKLDQYDGCFNDRNKRGGGSKSTHAYAAALDFNAADNPLRADHRTARFAKPEYAPWFEAWESEGAVSLGRERDYDWMHVQFARL